MDLNKTAFRIVQQLTDENRSADKQKRGSAGGKVGGIARATKLTPERKREIAVIANQTRWGKTT